MEKLLEECYEKGDKAFSDFVETYASGKGDYGISDLIMQVYTYSQSHPWPKQWLEECRKEARGMEEPVSIREDSPWIRFLMKDIRNQVEELVWQMEDAKEICQEPGGPEVYLPTIEENLSLLRQMKEAKDFEELGNRLERADFGKLKAVRSKEVGPGEEKICK